MILKAALTADLSAKQTAAWKDDLSAEQRAFPMAVRWACLRAESSAKSSAARSESHWAAHLVEQMAKQTVACLAFH